MTEDEAKTKRCCGPEGCGEEHSANTTGFTTARYCIGSACMGWRFSLTAKPTPHSTGGITEMVHTITLSTTEGYCGHAGKPNE